MKLHVPFEQRTEASPSMGASSDPTPAKRLNKGIPREKLVKLAKKLGVELRQSYTRVGKFALIQHQRYAWYSDALAGPSGAFMRRGLGF